VRLGREVAAQPAEREARVAELFTPGAAMEAVNDLGVVGFYTKGCPAEELIAKIRATLAARPTQTAADVLTQEEKDFFSKG